MTDDDETNPVKPALRRAEAEVARHLEEACDDIGQKDLSQESLDELLRLEDELLAAARAVDKTVRLRRQLGERSTSPSEPPAPSVVPSVAPTPTQRPEETAGCRLRDFRDLEGREWRVWEVRPGSTGRRINPERYLGEYVKGWLAFECLRDEMRKRLLNHPSDWFAMPDVDLEQLLPRAVEVPKRTPKASDAVTR
jgi:hypothetical protein